VLTIVTVVLNDKSNLQLTAKSLEREGFQGEWIIKNGGSTATVEEALTGVDLQCTVVHMCCSDAGIYHAMNQAIPAVSGTHVMFLNAGDTLMPGSVQTIDLEIHRTQGRILKFLVEVENGIIRKERATRYYLARRMLNHQGLVYPIGALRRNAFDSRMRVAGDVRHLVEYSAWRDIAYRDVVTVRYLGSGFASLRTSVVRNWKERLSVFSWRSVPIDLRIVIWAVASVGVLKGVLAYKRNSLNPEVI